jgi:hypothetical protein
MTAREGSREFAFIRGCFMRVCRLVSSRFEQESTEETEFVFSALRFLCSLLFHTGRESGTADDTDFTDSLRLHPCNPRDPWFSAGELWLNH